MAFFDLFHLLKREKKKADVRLPGNGEADDGVYERTLKEIAGIISGGDKNTASELTEYYIDAEQYFHDHYEEYCGIMSVTDFDAAVLGRDKTRRWDILTMILEKNHYLCTRDWKDEKDDFVYFIQNLVPVKTNALTVQAAELRQDGCISEWCGLLDENWKGRGMCVGAMDIGCDAYAMFVCAETDLAKLKSLAAQIGERIDSAKAM